MAKGVRVRKTAHRRQVSTITPEQKPLDPLLQKCKDFLDVNSSLSMDDSYDRDRLAEEMVEFIATLEPFCERCLDVLMKTRTLCEKCYRDSDD